MNITDYRHMLFALLKAHFLFLTACIKDKTRGPEALLGHYYLLPIEIGIVFETALTPEAFL